MRKTLVSGITLAVCTGFLLSIWNSARKSIEAFHHTPYGLWE